MDKNISVSKEYLETVREWLEEWVLEENSWTIPQFLQKKGIGWTYFEALLNECPFLHSTFEKIIASLHAKWLAYAMARPNISSHMQKILFRYLTIYDTHALLVEKQIKKEIAENSQFSFNQYFVEDYSKRPLKGIYKEIYEENEKKSEKEDPP